MAQFELFVKILNEIDKSPNKESWIYILEKQTKIARQTLIKHIFIMEEYGLIDIIMTQTWRDNKKNKNNKQRKYVFRMTDKGIEFINVIKKGLLLDLEL